MRSTSTARADRTSWQTRGRTIVLAAALTIGALPVGTAAAGGPSTLVVRPGESIQAAVDRASSGDTIKIAAGTYQEAVCVEGKGLTIVGAGPNTTLITWPEWGQGAPLPEVAPNACWEAHEATDAEGDPGTLADDVSGIFFLNPDSPVSVAKLGTRNHPASGILGWQAHGFTVKATSGIGHERYGVLASASTDITIAGNVEKGVDRGAPWFSGTAGIGIGDSDGANARVTANYVEGFNLGIFVRESRGGSIVANKVTGNCVGVLFFDDAVTEVPDNTRQVQGGDFTIKGNASIANNRYCIAGRGGEQLVSGVGMSITNADSVRVVGNLIKGNRPVVPAGAEPVNYPAGGLTLVSFAPPPGTLPPGVEGPGLVENIEVTSNRILDNQPVDIWVTRPIPNTLLQEAGPGITFRGNNCRVSDPAGICAR
ncbi:right-handed parallel beta-helix repeat-containing protein [Modestobacter sp. VKM Ac-2985]|uniref:right-handed parallel beta-helix repeat-containing protein n=1 Tax=Modestobacter sp. VKM Ac-2985 TaxID=3004139 RepID=UPI0022AB753D|nr:right-handed parallel beta-helix repeat-containing protein [Modestobacter sp. VKM Ac-2985]MCZ2837649.1 right-handed parallel beta-helix repeat-containing protein [Modestobacter sp. VKM Ac-2985]